VIFPYCICSTLIILTPSIPLSYSPLLPPTLNKGLLRLHPLEIYNNLPWDLGNVALSLQILILPSVWWQGWSGDTKTLLSWTTLDFKWCWGDLQGRRNLFLGPFCIPSICLYAWLLGGTQWILNEWMNENTTGGYLLFHLGTYYVRSWSVQARKAGSSCLPLRERLGDLPV
jgi:hypothetical protein